LNVQGDLGGEGGCSDDARKSRKRRDEFENREGSSKTRRGGGSTGERTEEKG